MKECDSKQLEAFNLLSNCIKVILHLVEISSSWKSPITWVTTKIHVWVGGRGLVLVYTGSTSFEWNSPISRKSQHEANTAINSSDTFKSTMLKKGQLSPLFTKATVQELSTQVCRWEACGLSLTSVGFVCAQHLGIVHKLFFDCLCYGGASWEVGIMNY